MSTNDRIPSNLPILDSKNYDKWSKQMKVLFGYQEVLDIVNNGVTPLGAEPTAAHQATFREEKKKDYKALFLIHSCVDGDNFEKVGDCESARQAWLILEKAYAGAAKAKVVRFDNIVVAIEESKDLTLLSKDELQSSLEAHEQRMDERGSDKAKAELALQARFNERSKGSKGKWPSKGKQGDGEPKHSKGQKGESSSSNGYGDRSNARGGKPRDMSKVQCWKCRKLGHFQAKCGAKQLETKGDEAKVARQEVDDEATLLMMITDECEGMTEVLDSSCKSRDSSCSSAEKATVLSSEQNVMISVRDGTQGKEEWYLDSGCSTHMTGRRDCIGQLLEKGYNIRLEDKILRVVDASGVLILKAPMATNRTFKVELKVLEHRCLATAASREEWLWHYRLGHLNFRDLKALQQEGMVTGLPHINIPAELCEECRKDEVFDVFKRFKSMAERQCGRKLKVLKTDGGGEYTSVAFGKYCDDEGIVREVVPPYTPQQNGIAERKNRSIMNMVRSMLSGKSLPKELWGEAVSTATYLLNRCPTKKLEKLTPEEAWCGFKPNLSHLRVFGSVAYKHVPGQLRKKLDDKGEEMIFVGYHSTGGYKLFDARNRKIQISRDEKQSQNSAGNSVTGYSQAVHTGVIGYEQNRIPTAVFFDDPVSPETVPQPPNDVQTEGHRRRSTRQRVLPSRLQECERFQDNEVNNEGDFVHFALMAESEPVNTEEALRDPKWICAMKEELESIEKNGTWELVDLPHGKKPIGVRWVFKVKANPKGEIIKYKARFVAKGFLQREGIDFEEELNSSEGEAITLLVDNVSAINLAKNPIAHGRSKHIEMRFHYLRELVSDGKLRLGYCRSEDQVADLLTKGVTNEVFKRLRRKLSMVDLDQLK
ncbi:uncharacterized protein LOC131639000 [Vicia villosa]|uniref:uncharacterized protein LOC131639000 n=1 Tax=Vicia villosa TaxID=3911 RepID=UPI00273AFD48|nr:uncharacterized protein LOC131639000 [Vicia villosa]